MMNDWKAALAALNASGVLPPGDSEDENSVVEDKKDEIQKASLRIYIDRRARKGKEATVIEGFLCDDDKLKEIARTLKQSLGCGGSVRSGEMLLQGDVREKVAAELKKMGYKSKLC